MAIDTQSGIEVEALQTILVVQGKPVTYEEASEIGHELLDFFEALGDEEDEQEDKHA